MTVEPSTARRSRTRRVHPARSVISIGVLRALVVRPRLWPTALVVALRLAPPGWWRTRPHLPIPDPDYLRFRMVTAYGGDGQDPARPEDLVTYLEWCRAWPSLTRRP